MHRECALVAKVWIGTRHAVAMVVLELSRVGTATNRREGKMKPFIGDHSECGDFML